MLAMEKDTHEDTVNRAWLADTPRLEFYQNPTTKPCLFFSHGAVYSLAFSLHKVTVYTAYLCPLGLSACLFTQCFVICTLISYLETQERGRKGRNMHLCMCDVYEHVSSVTKIHLFHADRRDSNLLTGKHISLSSCPLLLAATCH